MSSLVEDNGSVARGGAVRFAIWAAGGAGLAVAIALVARSGLPAIAALLRGAGWRLLWLAPLHLIPLALDASGWRRLLRGQARPGRVYLTGIAVVREAVGTLLPLRVGGEIVGIRLLIRRGIDRVTAAASVVVEVTLWLLTQMLFAVIGLALVVGSPRAGSIPRYAATGLLLVALAVGAFLIIQRRVGLFVTLERVLEKVVGRDVARIAGDPRELDAAIRALYRYRAAITSCMAWQLAGFAAGAAETWITFRLLGRPVSFTAAVIVESLSAAVQSATFVVPAGLGTQEASLVLLGAAVGVPSATALALSMARRARQLILGIPATVAWYWGERGAG
jgi:putative membrane protein